MSFGATMPSRTRSPWTVSTVTRISSAITITSPTFLDRTNMTHLLSTLVVRWHSLPDGLPGQGGNAVQRLVQSLGGELDPAATCVNEKSRRGRYLSGSDRVGLLCNGPPGCAEVSFD